MWKENNVCVSNNNNGVIIMCNVCSNEIMCNNNVY
jgi:hypothetical protein